METIDLLRSHIPDIKASFAVKRIGIFGSFSRGEQKESSDIDILVEFEKLREKSALRCFLWLKSGYYGFPVLVRLRTYSVNSVSSVVETSPAAVYGQMVTDVHHKNTKREGELTEYCDRLPTRYSNEPKNLLYCQKSCSKKEFCRF